MIEITDKIAIDESEVTYRFARSGGPGGQNVNKLSTKVTLLFDVKNSPSLNDEQKQRIMDKLNTRINRYGVLRVICRKHRTQKANKEEALERFAALIRNALYQKAARIKTRAPTAAVEKRLEEKKKHSRKKEYRRKDYELD